MRIFRTVLLTLLALLGLVVLALVLLMAWVNPNDYRDEISRLVRDSAGVELTLGGDLSWRFFPVLGFGAKNVGLALRPGLAPLVKVSDVTVGVKILPLFSSHIAIDALDIDGLRATLVVDKQGKNNWQLAETTSAQRPGPAPPAAAAPLPTLSVPRVRVHDAKIVYRDETAGVSYTVDLPSLELRDVSFDKPFPLRLQARLRNGRGLDITMHLKGSLSVNPAGRHYGADQLQLAATVAGPFAKPVKIDLQGSARYDQSADRATVKLTRAQLANLVAHAALQVAGISDKPAFSGQLDTDVVDARTLMEVMGLPVPSTRDAKALTRLQAKAQFVGTPQRITLKPLTLKLDDSTVSGEVAVVDVSKQAIRFALQLDKLDADRYLPPDTPAAPPVPAVPPASRGDRAAQLIPVATLRTLNLAGTFKAGELTVQRIPLRDLALAIDADAGNVRLHDLSAKLLAGSLAGNVTLNARSPQSHIATDIKLTGIELSQLQQPFIAKPLLSGRANLSVDAHTDGNDLDTLIRQALGQLNLTMGKAVVHGININKIASSALRDKLGQFTLLVPDYQRKLPKALEDDTEINHLLANMRLANGRLLMPVFNADTGEGQISAAGEFGLLNRAFDYHFGVVLDALSHNKYLKGTRWPVRCKGSLDTPSADWCRLDSKAVDKVLKDAAQRALRDKAAQRLADTLGVKSGDNTDAGQRLRDKAKKEEDRAKQKLRESLKNLFGR